MHPSFDPRNFDHRTHFRQIGFDSTLVCFTITRAGRIESVSDSCAQALGYTIDELRGRSVLNLFPLNEQQQIRVLLEHRGGENFKQAHRCTLIGAGNRLAVATVGCITDANGTGHFVAVLSGELPIETLRCERVPAATVGSYYDSQNYEHDENFHLGLFERPEEEFRIASERLLHEFFAQMGPLTGKTVLEIGCGLGHAAVRLIADHGCAQVDAVTISRVQHEICLRAARQHMVADRVNFLLADANEMEFPPDTYDAIVAMECIFHLDRDRVLAKVARSLKAGGIFAFCDIYPVEGGIAYSATGEHAFISPTQSIRLLRKHGFRDICLVDWSDRVRPSYHHIYGRAASIARLALRAGLSLEQTLELAARVQQRSLTPEAKALVVEEVLAQSQGRSKTDSDFGYCFIRATRKEAA